jgi:hypothetical protein
MVRSACAFFTLVHGNFKSSAWRQKSLSDSARLSLAYRRQILFVSVRSVAGI